MPQRLASASMVSWAWRLVPTKRIIPPLLAVSFTASQAFSNATIVCCKSRMWIPLRSANMYGFILGFQRCFLWPKCTPASSKVFMLTATFPPPYPKNFGHFKTPLRGFVASIAQQISSCKLFAQLVTCAISRQFWLRFYKALERSSNRLPSQANLCRRAASAVIPSSGANLSLADLHYNFKSSWQLVYPHFSHPRLLRVHQGFESHPMAVWTAMGRCPTRLV